MNFYVLKDSPSKEGTVTLILDRNIGSTTTFNSSGSTNSPDTVLAILKSITDSWNQVNVLNGTSYTSSNGYTINYNGYRARLLEPNDIYNAFGTTIDHTFFNTNTFFSIDFTSDSLNFLSNNLTGNSGYWMANMVSGNGEMAWTIQDKKITPVLITNNTMGVRPVIEVSKDILK